MYFRESSRLIVSNPVLDDFSKPVTEAMIADLKIKDVRAIYPLIKAINSGRLTKNYTMYPAESLLGKSKTDEPTGYASFVKPYGKPIIREHRAQDVAGMFGPEETADVPMGRIIFSGFRKRQKEDGPGTLPSKKYIPGTVEGDGILYIVPGITDNEAINRVLGGIYHTVSIGSNIEHVYESISGKNIAELRRKGEEMPPYERGQLYNGKLSYWNMGPIKGIETSFVNVPADEMAGVANPDIGVEGIKLLVAEKKSGKNSGFSFFDAKTSEEVCLDLDESVYDESFFVDSAKVGNSIWWMRKETDDVEATIKESVQSTEEKNMAKEKVSLDKLIKNYTESQKEDILKEYSTDLDVSDLVSGTNTERVTNTDLFAKVSEFAMSVCDDIWNEDCAKLALSLYLANEGEYLDPSLDEKATCGEVYGLEGDLASEALTITKKEWHTLTETNEDGKRTLPITNLETALFSVRVSKEVSAEASKFGIYIEDEKIKISPLMAESGDKKIPLLSVSSKEEVDPLLNDVETIAKSYNLDEAATENLKTYLEKCKELDFETSISISPLFSFEKADLEPTLVSSEYFLNYFMNAETGEARETLATLVGLVRQSGFRKEELETAKKAYSVFGTAVLKNFLSTELEKPKPAKAEETPENADESQISAIGDPAKEASEEAASGERTKSVRKDTVWLGLRVKQARQNDNNPKSKEKK